MELLKLQDRAIAYYAAIPVIAKLSKQSEKAYISIFSFVELFQEIFQHSISRFVPGLLKILNMKLELRGLKPEVHEFWWYTKYAVVSLLEEIVQEGVCNLRHPLLISVNDAFHRDIP